MCSCLSLSFVADDQILLHVDSKCLALPQHLVLSGSGPPFPLYQQFPSASIRHGERDRHIALDVMARGRIERLRPQNQLKQHTAIGR